MNVTNNGDGLGSCEYVWFILDDIVEAEDDALYEFEWYDFFLVKTLLEKC